MDMPEWYLDRQIIDHRDVAGRLALAAFQPFSAAQRRGGGI